MSTRKPKEGRWKNVGLLLQNLKPRIFHNECKSITNNIMRCSPLPTMDAMEEVDPHGFNCVPKSPKVICHQTKFQHCLAWCFHLPLPYCSQNSPYDIINILFSMFPNEISFIVKRIFWKIIWENNIYIWVSKQHNIPKLQF